MGFGEFLFDQAKKGYNALQEKAERIERYQSQYAGLSTEALKEKYRTCNDSERQLAIRRILAERG